MKFGTQFPRHAGATTALSEKETPEFIASQLWPTNSPDLNPVDYSVWEYCKRRCTKHALLIWMNWNSDWGRPWPLTCWPWTFVVLQASCVQTLCKIWTKSNSPRQSYSQFSTFLPLDFSLGPKHPNRSHGCMDQTSPNLETTQGNHHRLTGLSEFRYLAAFSNADHSKSSDAENDPKFRTFWPL